MRPWSSMPVVGSEEKPAGAACQRGSSGCTPGGRWKVTVRSVLPCTVWNQAGANTALAYWSPWLSYCSLLSNHGDIDVNCAASLRA